MPKLKIVSLLSAFLFGIPAMASNSLLTYSNSDFNAAQPGWFDTLTIYNNSAFPIVITQLQFDTNYNFLNTTQLYGSIFHSSSQPVIPLKIADFDYRYIIDTESSWSKGDFTTIPAHGSVNLTGIPLAHVQTTLHGVPVYYRLPFNVKVSIQNGLTMPIGLVGKCQYEACNDPIVGKMAGAYYTNWANYHYAQSPSNLLMPNQIPIRQLNTVFYDVAKVDPNTADILFTDINHDQYYLPAFDTLKQQYPYLNLIYSFGGWGDAGSSSYPSYDLAAIFDQQNPVLMKTLAKNMVHTMLELGFNGIDIDYEWTAIQPGTSQSMQLTPARALGYQELIQDIRVDLTKIQPASDPHYYKLTTAVFSGIDKVNEFVTNGGNWTTIAANCDDIDLMTYDMHGQFDTTQTPPDNITDFQSQMQTEHKYQGDLLNQYNVVDAVKAYENVGVPANKIVIGIPAYTRIEKTTAAVTDFNKGLYLTLADPSAQPAGEQGSGGTTDYKCILNNNYCWGGFTFNTSSLSYVEANFSNQNIGYLAKTPWAYDKSQNWFMSFDDGLSSKYKAAWAKQQGLAGTMVWELDGDVPLTDSNYQKTSVIYNAWLGLQH